MRVGMTLIAIEPCNSPLGFVSMSDLFVAIHALDFVLRHMLLMQKFRLIEIFAYIKVVARKTSVL